MKAFTYRAYVLYLMKRFEEAMQDCEHVIAANPTKFPDIYFVRGLVYMERKELDLAICDLKKSLDIKLESRVFMVSKVKEILEKLETQKVSP